MKSTLLVVATSVLTTATLISSGKSGTDLIFTGILSAFFLGLGSLIADVSKRYIIKHRERAAMFRRVGEASQRMARQRATDNYPYPPNKG